MPTYSQAPKDAKALLDELMQAHYPTLVEHGLKVGCLFACATRGDDGQPKGPAITLHGWPAAATVRIVSQKDRVAGLPDVMVTVDGDQWNEWEDLRKRAALHHELEHIELRLDEEGKVVLDACFRPKVKLKQHDFQLGGFHKIIEKYERHAIEAQALFEAGKHWHQQMFQWG